jgi:hypothetical protein
VQSSIPAADTFPEICENSGISGPLFAGTVSSFAAWFIAKETELSTSLYTTEVTPARMVGETSQVATWIRVGQIISPVLGFAYRSATFPLSGKLSSNSELFLTSDFGGTVSD